MLHPDNLHQYQLEMVDFLIENPRSALFAGLGLGKTITTLTALAELIAFGEVARVLIIAPKRVASTVWHAEAKNWSHTKHLRVLRAVGSPSERRSAILASLAFDHGIVTINPENLEWLVNMLKAMKRNWPFDTIVFDEMSMFKRSSSKRFETMEAVCCDYTKTVKGVITQIHSPVKRVYGLTATPAASGIENLWSQIKLLDSGERLGVRVSHFRTAFMTNTAPPGVQYQNWKPASGASENVYNAIADIVKVMLPEDHLDMPDLIHNDILVDIPVKVRRDMKTLEAEFLLEVENNGLDEQIIAANAGALANKLMQFCLSEGTEVLTDCGWIPIENVTSAMKVWDGIGWVSHEGLLHQGVRQVQDTYGIAMTPDHEVLTTKGWRTSDEQKEERLDREKVQLPDGAVFTEGACRQRKNRAVEMSLRLWQCCSEKLWSIGQRSSKRECAELRVPQSRATTNTRYDGQSGIQLMVSDASEVLLRSTQRLSTIRRSGHNGVRSMVSKFRELLSGYGGPSREHDVGSRKQRWGLLPGELQMGYANSTVTKSKIEPDSRRREGSDVCGGSCGEVREMPCYDLSSCGPRSRFVARGVDGPVIVHNCNGAVYLGDPQDPDYERRWGEVHTAKLDALAEMDGTCDYPLLVAYWFKSDLERIQKRFPKWKVLDKKGSQIDAWNKGKISRLLIHPASASFGLNLQHGGHTMILFSMFWSLELYQQLIGRLHRQGQSQSVSINRIVVRDSIEQRVAMTLSARAEVQSDLLEYLNEYKK